MFTATKRVPFVNALVALWATKRSPELNPAMAMALPVNRVHRTPARGCDEFTVNRAGRTLTDADFARMKDLIEMKGGDSDVQFGFLGSFRGIGILGESPS